MHWLLLASCVAACSAPDASPPAESTSGTIIGGAPSGSSGVTGRAGDSPTTGGSSSMAGSSSNVGNSSTAGSSSAAGGAGPGVGGVAGGGEATAGAPTTGGVGGSGPSTSGGMPSRPYFDPGSAPWVQVPAEQVAADCKLDPAELAKAAKAFNVPWAIFRYGKLCWENKALSFNPSEAWSTTKTLGALVAGMVAFQTKAIPRTGKKTGGFSDEDRADHWLDSFSYNKEAKVAHVLGMVAHGSNLAYGSKSFAYDTVGSTQINTLSTMLNSAIAQDKARLGENLEQFTKKFLYEKLGMTKSVWSSGRATKVFAYSWSTDLLDMARVGQLILNYGVWGGEQLVDREWIYRMTHPSFEDANTGFGYLTWLNSSSNWTSISGGKQQVAGTPGSCAPVAVHARYPHGVSEAKDCAYKEPYTCEQQYDVGVWNAEGLGGQLIQGHRGLDIVIVARNAQPGGVGPGTAKDVWDALRKSVIVGDPMFKGDEAAFCKAYGSNSYAPDLH